MWLLYVFQAMANVKARAPRAARGSVAVRTAVAPKAKRMPRATGRVRAGVTQEVTGMAEAGRIVLAGDGMVNKLLRRAGSVNSNSHRQNRAR